MKKIILSLLILASVASAKMMYVMLPQNTASFIHTTLTSVRVFDDVGMFSKTTVTSYSYEQYITKVSHCRKFTVLGMTSVAGRNMTTNQTNILIDCLD